MLTNVKTIYCSVVMSEINILDIPFNSILLHPILMQVGSRGQKDPLEEEMATHSSNLAWKNPMDWEAWQVTVHETETSFGITFTLEFTLDNIFSTGFKKMCKDMYLSL